MTQSTDAAHAEWRRQVDAEAERRGYRTTSYTAVYGSPADWLDIWRRGLTPGQAMDEEG